MSSGKKKAEEGITGTGNQVFEAGKITPQEEGAYQGSFQTGNQLQEIFKYLMGLGNQPQGYLSPEEQFLRSGGELGKSLYGTALKDVQDPYASYEGTLQSQLKLTEDYINSKFAERGLLRSGLNIEGMGRAGAELAIAEADKRMAYGSEALQRGAGMYDTVQSGATKNLQNLGNLYQQQQNAGLQAKSRSAGQAVQAAPYWSYGNQAALGSYYGGQAALQALPGQLIGAGGTIAAAKAAPSTFTYNMQYPKPS